jgi:type II secretory ATPase GspE/PulE/Tfp pilus assembly ATPase PilB-like protein
MPISCLSATVGWLGDFGITLRRRRHKLTDSIKYQLRGFNQFRVRPQISLTRASQLRSLLRRDPDVMAGEMPDLDTASC